MTPAALRGHSGRAIKEPLVYRSPLLARYVRLSAGRSLASVPGRSARVGQRPYGHSGRR